MNRCQLLSVLPPNVEKWFLYITGKYPKVPRYLVGFLAGMFRDLYSKDEHQKNITDLSKDKQMFTTPKSMEAFCKAYDDLLTRRCKDSNHKNIMTYLAGIISNEDYLQVAGFMEHMSRLQEYLDNNENINRSTQIGVLTYIGEIIRDLALSENVSFVLQNALLPYDKINFYVRTFGNKDEESLRFLVLGSGICDRNIPVMRSIYALGVMIGVLQSKSPEKAKEFADTEFKYANIQELWDALRSEFEDYYKRIEKYCSNDPILSKIADTFKYYNETRINRMIELAIDYWKILGENDDKKKKKTEELLKDYLTENELKNLKLFKKAVLDFFNKLENSLSRTRIRPKKLKL